MSTHKITTIPVKKAWLPAGILLFFFLPSCIPSWLLPDTDPQNGISDTILRVNKFIKDDMETYYLWSSKLPNIDYKTESDPFKYFDALLYTEDVWSFMTDDYEALSNSLSGTEKSFGYSLTFGQFNNTNTYFAIVEYVNPNTPASRASIKRGDIIVGFDGNDITADNYMNLFYKETITLNMGTYNEQGINRGADIALQGELLTTDPVLISKVIETNGWRIGYLLYNQFIEEFNTSLDNALQLFKNQSITDLVLDLRYNPGGAGSAARHLCSSLAPLNAVNGKLNLVTYQWNDLLTDYWKKEKETDALYINFDNTVAVKLGLSKVYVLTGGGTASASEYTITGLQPYADVILIGDTTYGKYTGSITLQPMVEKDKKWVVDEVIGNWAIQPIVFQYANSVGFTGFKNGIPPTHYVKDVLLPAVQLGETNEPLLAKAIEQITGGAVLATKSQTVLPEMPYNVVARGSSKFQPFKTNLVEKLESGVVFGY